jgi:type II secretory pathway pseudopilin PulG
LIEAALLLSLLAVVLAVFVPTFVRRVQTNKITEASEQLANMSRGAQAYFATSWSQSERDCLPPSAGPTPEAPTVDPKAVDFFSEETPGHATWKALSFQPDRAVRFSYRYTASQDGCGLLEAVTDVAVTFRAEGDLDGDGVLSTFERRASIGRDGFVPAESLRVHQRTE